MKKLATVALAATLLFGSFNVIADASAAELRDKLVSLGVPSDSANQCKRVIITRIEKRRPHLYTGITDEVSFLLDSFTMFLNLFCPG